MRKVRIAFDVDGTLRCNCSESCVEPNPEIVQLFRSLTQFKNTEMYVWSGGGAERARHFAELFELPVKQSRCIGKFGAPAMHVCVDDEHSTELGYFNLIVRCK